MERTTAVEFEFVDYMPTTLREAMIYVSIRFRISTHLCLCGCGEKVVNPLRPDQWSMAFDGSTISLSPSVGNSGLPCKSHYWITHNKVRWLPPMTEQHSSRAFQRDGWVEPLIDTVTELPDPTAKRRSHWLCRVLARRFRRG